MQRKNLTKTSVCRFALISQLFTYSRFTFLFKFRKLDVNLLKFAKLDEYNDILIH